MTGCRLAGNRERAAETAGCYNSCPRRINVKLGKCRRAVEERTGSSAEESRTAGHSFESVEWSRRSAWNYHETRPCSAVGRETKDNVGCVTQTNCSRPARALGKMESGTEEKVGEPLCSGATGSRRSS